MRTSLFHRTMQALEQDLHCRLIASDLDFQQGVFAEGASDEEVLAYAVPRQFTRVALATGSEQGARRVTHVAIVNLEAGRLEQRREITVQDLIADSTPISQAIDLLTRRPFYFLLDGSAVRQIMTVSDLNRLPVRTYLHVLLDHLEGLLADWIDQALPSQDWMKLLGAEVRTAISTLHESKVRSDFDTRLVDCTMLSQKCAIVGKVVGLRNELGLQTASATSKESALIIRLRNRLDHGIPPLDKNADDLRDHLQHGNQLTKRADVEWLSRTVQLMRRWIGVLADEEETP